MMPFRNKKAKSLNNAWTYVVILFLFVLVTIIIQESGKELLAKDLRGEITLSNSSIEYIGRVNAIDLSGYQANKEDWQESQVTNSSGTPKDYAMEFLFSREKGADIESPIKRIYNIPGMIIVTLFNQPVERFSWITALFGWILVIAIGLVVYYFIRGGGKG